MPEKLDLHVYTNNSPNGHDKIAFLCEIAVRKGLRGVAFTDRCRPGSAADPDARRRIRHAYFDACKAKLLFFDSLSVFAGVELEDARNAPGEAGAVLARRQYDIVLASVSAEGAGSAAPAPGMTADAFRAFCGAYAAALCDTVAHTDFDALSRLMAPLRAACPEPAVFESAMLEPLGMLAESGRSLEVNARDLCGSERLRDLYLRLIAAFRSFGGENITLGSESSFHDELGEGLDLAAAAVKRLGFQQSAFYDRRIPYRIDL